jgi:uncharacterized protein YjdB
MKKKRLLQLLIFLLVAAYASVNAQTNLVQNPGFENDLQSWQVTGGNGVIVTSDVNSGSKALRVGPANWSWVQQNLSGYSIGQSYTLSAWGKAASQGNSVRVAVKNNSQTLANLTFSSTTYEQKSITVTVPSGTSWLQVFITNATSGTGYVDDIVFSSGTSTPVDGVSVSPTTATVATGATTALTATVSPGDATNKNVTWSSSNTNVATVSASGVVTGVAAGSATITVTTQDGGFTATCAITVPTDNVPVTGVTVNPTTATVAIGATTALTETVSPGNATNKNVTWSSSNTSVATVSASGVVTGVAAGSATITVTTQDGGFTATCAVTVTDEPVTTTYNDTDLTFSSGWHYVSGLTDGRYMGDEHYTYTAGSSYTFTFTGTRIALYGTKDSHHGNANVSINGGSNTTISYHAATRGVDQLIWTSPLLPQGTHNITVTSVSSAVIVADRIVVYSEPDNIIHPTSVTVSPTTASVEAGATTTLTATVLPSNATNKSVTWSSSNTSVATVSSSGVVTGVAAGSATITVTTQDGGLTATCAVTVTGESGVTIPARIQAEDWIAMSGVQTQTTSDEGGGLNVGWIDQGDWMDYAINVPSAGTYAVDFRLASPNSGRQLQLRVGSTTLATVTVPQTGGWQNWQTVSTTANLSAGSQTIRILASSGSGWNINWFEIKSESTIAPTSVTVSPTTASVAVGATTTLTATVLPSNATNKNVTWSSSNTSVATVSSSGVVTGVAAGSATITVTTQDGGLTATCAVTVTSVPDITYYVIRNAKSGNLLRALSGSSGSGLRADGTDESSDLQLWEKISAGNGNYYLKSKAGNLYLRAGTGQWSMSELSTTQDNSSQWSIPADNTYGRFDHGATTYSLESWYADGSTVNLNTYWSSNSFSWRLEPMGPVPVTPVTGVSVSPTSTSVAVGSTTTLTATVSPGNATNKNVSWSTSNSAIATVNSNGLVTGVAEGSATITVTTEDGGFVANSSISVSGAPLPSNNFTVVGSKIYDPCGNEFYPVGANLNGPNWVWPGTCEGGALNFKNVWNFNTVRLNMAYYDILRGWPTFPQGQMITSAQNQATLDRIIDEYTSLGIVVQLELHDWTGTYPNSSDVQKICDQFRFWANRYKDNPWVWFNPINEPGGHQDNPVNPLYRDVHREFVKAIRDDAGANNMIVIDGAAYGQDVGGTYNANLVEEQRSGILSYGQSIKSFGGKTYENVIFAFHVYGQWGFGTDAQRATKMIDYIDRVHAKGLHLHVGELGWYSNNQTDPEALGTRTAYQVCPGKDVGVIAWHGQPGDGFSLVASGSGNILTYSSLPSLSWTGQYIYNISSQRGGVNCIPNQFKSLTIGSEYEQTMHFNIYSDPAEGISESEGFEQNMHFNVYPNPVEGNRVTIVPGSNYGEGSVTLTLRDISGRTILNRKMLSAPEIELSLPDILPGVYLLTVQNEKGHYSKTLVVR